MKFRKIKKFLPCMMVLPLLTITFIHLLNVHLDTVHGFQIYDEYKVYFMNSSAFIRVGLYFKDIIVFGVLNLIVYYLFLYTDTVSEQETSIHMFMMSRFKSITRYWIYLFLKYLMNSFVIIMGYGALLVAFSNTQHVRFVLSPNSLVELFLQGIKIALLMVFLKLLYNFINIATKNGSRSIHKIFTVFMLLLADIIIGKYHLIVMPDTYDINLRYISIYICFIVMTYFLYWGHSKKIGEYYD
ncbi:beta-carotene 15,15'-monooxygenase [Erysipelothrix rhusiopathiae]|nr:beta-carotene 15,15'-monooxygenase [Erysipelothrix sp. strain 2 (EsS2-6-Brazil)]MBK2404791.1 beta-carotene 15,15'-monooxygenase [Erysipelothrix sp. strain 2 (EsS2-7-Brazil)]NBA00803.1 beta-carotene 15,15'-monooxygenase [Erysipelothrix rhusiopathiae]